MQAAWLAATTNPRPLVHHVMTICSDTALLLQAATDRSLHMQGAFGQMCSGSTYPSGITSKEGLVLVLAARVRFCMDFLSHPTLWGLIPSLQLYLSLCVDFNLFLRPLRVRERVANHISTSTTGTSHNSSSGSKYRRICGLRAGMCVGY
jgi:hypothetical protein